MDAEVPVSAGSRGADRPWPERWIGVARALLGFGSFGIVVAAMGYLVLPVVRLFASGDRRKDELAQRAIRHGARFCLWLWDTTGLASVRLPDARALADRAPVIVVSNHPTRVDTLLVLSVVPQIDVVVGVGWAESRWMGPATRAAGYIPNDGGPAVVEEAAARLRAGRSVLIFPEGTRSPIGSLGRFYRGAAHTALAAGLPDLEIIPVGIVCEPRVMAKGVRWTQVGDQRFRYEAYAGKPIRVGDYLEPASAEGPSRVARRLTSELERRVEELIARGTATP